MIVSLLPLIIKTLGQMPAAAIQKKCLLCHIGFFGRADKKFCSDHCRNAFHNENNISNNNYLKSVNSILKKNRKILEHLCPSGKTKVAKNKMLTLNFNFNYFTNIYKTSTGNKYFFCYEYGYLILENDIIMIVLKKEFI